MLRGTPVSTFDLDVVYERGSTNIERLLRARDELQAVVRDDLRNLRLNKSHLETAGHKLLETNQGPLDLLGSIEDTTSFDELIPDSDWLELGATRARVVSLERLIQIKQRLGRPKDQAMLPLLIATLDEANRPK